MPLDLERLEGLAGFRVALRRFLAASEAISKSAGVTQPQYQALLAIKTWAPGAMTIKDLADQLLQTHHAAVQLVDRLAVAGLVQRKASKTDRRSVWLKLTPAGEKILAALAESHLNEMLRQEPLLTKSLRQLRQLKPKSVDAD